ncbi:UvrD-helicase domain-containing protein [Streptomyces sp. NPDC086023]|uniref:UvrD-helicase domain-containing protein n=1 Tax=Streptomyces sp. NPDC086023 TaxID=3365746 RepID=UPI0037D728F9
MSARITDPEQLKELLGIPFTPEQTACITAPPAPQVIVAGAGSGKTTVMAARVVWLVGTGQVAPEQVLGLTFTNKAAGELAERVRAALVRAGVTDPDPLPGDPDGVAGEPRISTYHAFAGQLLTDHGMRIGLEPSARLLADATRFQLAARVLREAPGPYPALTRSLPDLVGDVLALDSELSEHLVEPDRLRAYDTGLLAGLAGVKLGNEELRKVPAAAAARLELLELTERYRAAKRSRDLLDFSDQIALSARLATTRPEVGALLREEFRIVLLDEYQDTSVAQRLLLSGLFGGGTGHAVTAVGDPCQAIYGWRGASVANLDDFPEHFPYADGSPATRYSLSENRRSGGRLLDLANGLAAPLRAMHEGVEALRPAPGAERDGFARCALLRTHAEELDWLADSLAHLVRTGTAPGEIAVLCRSAADFPAIQGALVARDVPVEVVGLSGLLHLPEVADLVAMCEVLQDPGANASLVRLLIGPRWRIGARDLALLGRRARLLVARERGEAEADRLAEAVEGVDPSEIISLADALDAFLDGGAEDGLPFSADARVRFARFAAELRDLRRGLADPLMDVLHRVLSATGLDVELSASPHALAARRRETLSNFLDVAAGFAALDGQTSLLAFLSFLRTAAEYEKGLDNSLPGGENTVKVLTAHKSKGLEWDVVAVPSLVTGAFPSDRPRESWTAQPQVLPHALRGDAATLPDVGGWTSAAMKAYKAEMKDHTELEELRLGYVTFTRPRSLLLASGHWWGPSQKRLRGPSAFLEALYAHCATGHGEIEVWAERPGEDESNPALDTPAHDRSWPLPLDRDSLRRRRAAADLVLAHLEASGPDAGAGGTGPGRRGSRVRPAVSAPAAVPGDELWDDSWDRPAGVPSEEPRGEGPADTRPAGPGPGRHAGPPAADAEEYLWPPHCDDPFPDDWYGSDAPPPSEGTADAAQDGPAPGRAVPASGAAPGVRATAEPDPTGDRAGPAGHRFPGEADHRQELWAGEDPRADLSDRDDARVPQSGHHAPAAGPGPDLPDAFGHAGADEDPWAGEGAWAGRAAGPRPAGSPAADGAGDRDAPWPDGDPWADEDPWAGEDPWIPASGGGGAAGSALPTDRSAGHPFPGAGEDPWGDAPQGRPADASARRPAGTDEAASPRGAAGDFDDPWAGEDLGADAAPGYVGSPSGSGLPEPRAGGWPARARAGAAGPRTGSPRQAPRLTPEEARLAASWDRDLEALAGELRRARAAVRDVPLPQALTASQLQWLAADEEGFVRELARPMPKPPQPAARRGTRFHAWVESRFDELELPLLDPEDLPGTDAEIADERDLELLKASFERSEYAARTPYRMEVPVQVTLAGRVVRGRIDAVYRTDDGGFEIVDWKTGHGTNADPLQLAIYRLAWAEAHGIDPERVAAAFLHVRSGRVIRPSRLPGRAGLERILQGKSGAGRGPRTGG